MKTLIIVAIAILPAIVSCKKDEAKKDIAAQINSYPKEALNSNEIASLIQMREEERLAHDVYIALYNKWGVTVFNNIASSEQTHMEAVKTLLTKYDMTDPANNLSPGVFTDSNLQVLYNQLLQQGLTSELDAFKVGATIEDLDLFDLKNWSVLIDNQDIKYVYDNLALGSRNHMRSFYSQIIGANGSYSAQFISAEELSTIVNSAKETGGW